MNGDPKVASMRQPVESRRRMTIIRIAAHARAAINSARRDLMHLHDHAAMNRHTVRLAHAPRSLRCARLRIGDMRERGGSGIDRAHSRLAQ